jgi:tetratricopeptide (TPR) repeat protein
LIRIRVQLIDPFRDEHLWAESYEHEVGDVVALQARIAEAIAGQIRARLIHQRAGLPISRRRVNPEAYERYLKGRFFLSKRSDAEKSLDYFEKAIALDPTFAPAHAGLADSYVLLGVLYLRRPREVFP